MKISAANAGGSGSNGKPQDAGASRDGAADDSGAAHEGDSGRFGFSDLESIGTALDAAANAHTTPPGWSCDAALAGDGHCDCGCGGLDPDCGPGAGCALPECDAEGCELCHDSLGRPIPCPDSYLCDPATFADGAHCDCGCGSPDPDCDGLGCDEPGCDAPACDLRHDAAATVIRPDAWVCDVDRFGALDGCDCGCGAIDPDCSVGCAEPGCRALGCDQCRLADGTPFECLWSCELSRFNDGAECDCGCGTEDPDCGNLGCTEPGCFASGCERCAGGDGELSCERGRCDSAYFGDGVCDCGCREHDPDCGGALACVEPGCSEDDCQRCHDADGMLQRCGNWLCSFEGQGTGDGCNCGCGTLDPDCAQDQGCATPGCQASGCVTCRSSQGKPMSCGE